MSLAPNPATDPTLLGDIGPAPIPQDAFLPVGRGSVRDWYTAQATREHERNRLDYQSDDELLAQYEWAARSWRERAEPSVRTIVRSQEYGNRLSRFVGGFLSDTVRGTGHITTAAATVLENRGGYDMVAATTFDAMGITDRAADRLMRLRKDAADRMHDYAEHLREVAATGADESLPEWMNAMLYQASLDPSGMAELGMIAAQAVPSAATFLFPGGLVARSAGAAILGLYGTRAFGHGVEEYRHEMLLRGVEPVATEAMLVGIGYGVTEMAVERMDHFVPWQRLSVGGANRVTDLLMRGKPNAAAKFVANSVGFGITEAGEELLTDVLQQSWASLTYGKEFEINAFDAAKGGFIGAQFVTIAGLAGRRSRRMLLGRPQKTTAELDHEINRSARKAMATPTGRMLAVLDAINTIGRVPTAIEAARIRDETVRAMTELGMDPAHAAAIVALVTPETAAPQRSTGEYLQEYALAIEQAGGRTQPKIATNITADQQATIDLWRDRGLQIIPIEPDAGNPLPGYTSATPGVVMVEMGVDSDAAVTDAILAHEVFHTLQRTHPDIYREFVGEVFGSIEIAAREQATRLAQQGLEPQAVAIIASPVATIREGSATLVDMLVGEAGLVSRMTANPSRYVALRDLFRRTITRMGLKGPSARAVLNAFAEAERRGFGASLAMEQEAGRVQPRTEFTARPDPTTRRLADAYKAAVNRPRAIEQYTAFSQETASQFDGMVASGKVFVAWDGTGTRPVAEAGQIVFDLAAKPDAAIIANANPVMFADSGRTDFNGKPLTYADLFAAVHATYGPDRTVAWRKHGKRYTKDALAAMTGYTRLRDAYEQATGQPAQEQMTVAPQWAYRRIRPVQPIPMPHVPTEAERAAVPDGSPPPPAVVSPVVATPTMDPKPSVKSLGKRILELSQQVQLALSNANARIDTARGEMALLAQATLDGDAGLKVSKIIVAASTPSALAAAADILFVAQVHAAIGLHAKDQSRTQAQRLADIARALPTTVTGAKRVSRAAVETTRNSFMSALRQRVTTAVADATETARERHADAVERLESRHLARQQVIVDRLEERATSLRNMQDRFTTLVNESKVNDKTKARFLAKTARLRTARGFMRQLSRLATTEAAQGKRNAVIEAVRTIQKARKNRFPAARTAFRDIMAKWGIDPKKPTNLSPEKAAEYQAIVDQALADPDLPLTRKQTDALNRMASRSLRDMTTTELQAFASEVGQTLAMDQDWSVIMEIRRRMRKDAHDKAAAKAITEFQGSFRSLDRKPGETIVRSATREKIRDLYTRGFMRPDTYAEWLFGENSVGHRIFYTDLVASDRAQKEAFYADKDHIVAVLGEFGIEWGSTELAGVSQVAANQRNSWLGNTMGDQVSPMLHDLTIGDQAVRLTPMEVVSLLGAMKDTDIRSAILEGAPFHVRRTNTDITITAQDMVDISAQFAGSMEAGVAEAMFRRYTGEMRQSLQARWMMDEGYDGTREEYWPTRRVKETGVDGELLNAEHGFTSVKSADLYHRRTGDRKSPFVLEDALSQYLNHSWQLQSIVHMSDTIRQARAVLNADGFEKATTDKDRAEVLRSLSAYLDRVVDQGRGVGGTGPSGTLSPIVRALRNSAMRGMLGLNPAVMAYQVVSTFPAMMEIHGTYIMQGISSAMDSSLDAEIEANSPTLRRRGEGSAIGLLAETATGRSGEFGFRSRLDVMRGISGMDWAAMRIIWAAAKAEVAATKPDLEGPEMLREVALRAELIVARTQPMSDIYSQSGFGMEALDNPMVAMFTMFTNQPNQNLNIAIRALNHGMRSGDWEPAIKAMLLAFLAQQGMVALIGLLWRDGMNAVVGAENKDTRAFLRRWATMTTARTAGSVYFGNVVGDFVDSFDAHLHNPQYQFRAGFDASPLLDLVSGVMFSTGNLTKAISTGDELRTVKEMNRLLERLGGLAGVPMSVTRPIRRGIENHLIEPEIERRERRKSLHR